MAAHRYWRIYITQTIDNYIAISEIELRNSAGGSDLTGSGTASASTAEGEHDPSSLVDNNTGTYWSCFPFQAPQWWSYDFGSGNAYDIIEIRITPHPTVYGQSPNHCHVQYSDDGSTWTSYWAITTTYSDATARTFTRPTVGASRYWRFYVTGTATGYVGFSEIELRSSVSGSDLTGSGTASASAEYSGSYVASNAVDNNTSTMWTAVDQVPEWWKYDFGSGVSYNIVEFKITPRTDGAYSQGPSDFTLEFSNDNEIWGVADSWTGVSWPNANPQTFEVEGPAGAVVSAEDSLSLSDAVEISLATTILNFPVVIAESITFAEGSVKAQRKNAPNIPIIIADQFSDSFEIIGEFGLQLDTMRDAEFAWDIADVFNLTDAIYSSEYIEIAAESDFTISDEISLGIALGVEAFDSFQDVWDPEAEIDIEIALAVPMEISVSDTLSFTDEIAFIRASGRELEDRFTLADSVRVRFEHYLEITGDLLALSDALEVGWNPSVEVADAISLDDTGGVETLIPSHIEIEVGVSESRLVVTEGLALFDGDFSTQGTEIFLGGTRLSYLRRYLNDVPR